MALPVRSIALDPITSGQAVSEYSDSGHIWYDVDLDKFRYINFENVFKFASEEHVSENYYNKSEINSIVNLTGANVVYVDNNPVSGQFSSIASAVNSITTASSGNPYLVFVGPGSFIEPLIQCKQFVYIVGSGPSTVVQPISPNQHIFEVTDNTFIEDMTVTGATGPGYSAFHCSGATTINNCIVRKIKFEKNYHFILNEPVSGVCSIVGSELFYGGVENPFNTGFVAMSGGRILIKNSTSVAGVNAYSFAKTSGSGSQVVINSAQARSLFPSGVCIIIENGGFLRATAFSIAGWDAGICINSGGADCSIHAQSINFENNATWDIKVNQQTASGYIDGITEASKVDLGNSFIFVPGKDSQIITVAKKGGDYDSIVTAINSITDASISKPYVVEVGPGVFTETPITMKQYVYVKGTGADQSSIITAADPTQKIIIGADNSGIENCLLTGAVSGGIAIYHEGNGTTVPFFVKSCLIGSNTTGVELYGASVPAIIQMDACRAGGPYNITNGFYVHAESGVATQLALTNFVYQDVIPPFASGDLINVSGPSAAVVIDGLLARVGSPTGNGLVIFDGAQARISSLSFRGFKKGIWAQNTGSAPFIKTLATALEGNTTDIQIDHPGTTGSIFGSATESKIINDSTFLPILLQDISSGNILVTGTIKQDISGFGFQDISTIIIKTSPKGLIQGGEISVVSGTTVMISAGFGYLEPGAGGVIRVDWNNENLVLPFNQTNYIYFNENKILSTSAGLPDTTNNILIGRISTGSGDIDFIDSVPMNAGNTVNLFDKMFRKAVGPLFGTGCITTHDGSGHIAVTQGNYFFSTNEIVTSGLVMSGTFDVHYFSGASVIHSSSNVVDDVYYNVVESGLVPLTTNYYTRHSLYTVGQGSLEKYIFIYGQEQFSNVVDAQVANNPSPSGNFTEGVTIISSIIVQNGSGIIEIRDERPRLGFQAGGTGGSSTSHSNLLNLDSDDHLLYLRTDGTRALTGNLNMGTNNITNVGNVDGVDVSAHASRHLPNGADPLATGTPVTVGTANSEGIANAFSRLDHVHSHGAQTNPNQHAVATQTAHGFLSSTDKIKLDGLQIQTINNQSGSAQILTTGTAGTTFNISSTGNTHTFNIPDASTTASGLITTSSQSFAGLKTFRTIVIGDGGESAVTAGSGAIRTAASEITRYVSDGANWYPVYDSMPKHIFWTEEFMRATIGGRFVTFAVGGGSTVTNVNSVAGIPGIVAVTAGNAAGRYAGLNTSLVSNIFGDGITRLDMWIAIPTLSTITNNYVLTLGFADVITGISTAQVDGAFFEYNRGTSANWTIWTANNSTRTNTITSTPVTASSTTVTHLTIIANAAGTSVEYFVDNVSVGTITTNIPTTAGRVFGVILKSHTVTGTPPAVWFDRVDFYKDLTTNRN